MCSFEKESKFTPNKSFIKWSKGRGNINRLPKSGLLHLIGKTYCKKGRSAKVKDGITNLILSNYLVDGYSVEIIYVKSFVKS